jgi:plastocyanin
MRISRAVFAFLALTAAACSDSTSSTNLCANSGAAVTVTAADNYTFTPSAVTITSGQSVCWQNTGHLNHTVIDAGGRFAAANLPAGQTFVFTFGGPQPLAGFRCGIHSTMTGTIVVN